MRFDNYDAGGNGSIKRLVKEKMIVLEDFDICSKDDEEMIKRLEQAIAQRPGVNPRQVLDYYCRPIIQEKVNSWN